MTAVDTSASPAATGTPVLAATGVSVRFGGLMALNDVDIDVAPGTIVGLVGPNGAGKTTLFNVLSGLQRPNSGRVRINGDDVTGESPQRRARLGMARTFQQLELFQDLTVREHVVLAHRIRHERNRLWTDLWSGRAWRRPPKEEDERVDSLVSLLGLENVADDPVAGLPLGTSRRVEVARALATSPSVLLLDEPSSGLDSTETEQLSHALRTIVAEEGVAMLLVEHDVAMVLGLSNRVTVLDFGVRIAEGTPEEVRNDDRVKAAYLGTADTTTAEGSEA
jgi:branched-chain amino acid transport system ATP-binding protein